MISWAHYWETCQQQGLQTSEVTLQRKAGHNVLVEIHASCVNFNEQEYLCIFIRESSERRREQQQLLQQRQALVALRERERLARELHDGAGQVLGYVNTQAQAVRELVVRGQAALATARLSGLINVVQEAQTDIREFIAGSQSSRGLYNTGVARESGSGGDFFRALEHYIEQFKKLYQAPVSFHVPSELADMVLPPFLQMQLLRIVQEALTNARKHAQASQVRITCSKTMQDSLLAGSQQMGLDRQVDIEISSIAPMLLPDAAASGGTTMHGSWLCIVIEDDGCGFDNTRSTGTNSLTERPGHGYGLHSMHSRATEIGGQVLINSTPGQGTQVTILVPLHPSQQPEQQRVLLVDDHQLFREGIRNLLVARGIEVIGTVSNGNEALEIVRQVQPDVIFMDIQMPQLGGLETTRLIKARWPQIQIVMLTASEEDDHLFEAIKSGASGYLLKSLAADELMEALITVLRGDRMPLPSHMASRVLQAFAWQTHPTAASAARAAPLKELTERQYDILQLLAEGLTYREIGARLHVSERTVKYHMSEIVSRLQFNNRAQLIAYARKHTEKENDKK